MERYCFALDLKNDPNMIQEYIAYHRAVWPEVLESIRESGVSTMEIFRRGNRLFMIMEVEDWFSFERKAAMDAANPKVQAWEELMSLFQQTLPGTPQGEKWVLMDRIFGVEAASVTQEPA
jgi:L-rhamnose mutarotase